MGSLEALILVRRHYARVTFTPGEVIIERDVPKGDGGSHWSREWIEVARAATFVEAVQLAKEKLKWA